MGLVIGRKLTLLQDTSSFCQLGQEDHRRLQALLLDMANDIYAYCKERNITITLGGGSCLGAVRHKGFIPWDEDMDLLMPRADYDEFFDGFEAWKPDKYYVKVAGKTPGYTSRMSRVFLKGTTARDFNAITGDDDGVFIDIFPLENTPDNSVLRRLHGLLSMAAIYVHSCRRYYQYRDRYRELFQNESEDVKRTIETKVFIGRLFGLCSCESMARFVERVNTLCKNNDSKYVTFAVGSKFYFGELVERQVHVPVSMGEFEGFSWPLPGIPDGYLSKLYGDYMTIPPEDKREHHYFIEFDLGEHLARADRLIEEYDARRLQGGL